MNVTITRGKKQQIEPIGESSTESPSAISILLDRFNKDQTSFKRKIDKIDHYEKKASETLNEWDEMKSDDIDDNEKIQKNKEHLLRMKLKLLKEKDKLLTERLMESLAVIENLLIEFRLEGKPVD